MIATPRIDWRAYAWPTAAALFAVSLQVLTTIEVRGVSLRVSSSDLLLPFLAITLFVKWVRDDTRLPEWRFPYFWGWLALLTVWMGISVLNGHLRAGSWQTWALVNKGVGWLILLAYLLAGGWMGAFLTVRVRHAFLKTFMLFGWVVCAGLIVLYSLALYGVIPHSDESLYYPRIIGLFANPNAFGIAMAAAAALLAPTLARATLFRPTLCYLGMMLLCATTVLTISRSAWVGLCLAALAFVVTKVLRWRDLAIVAGMSAILVLAALNGPGIVFHAVTFLSSVISPSTNSVNANAKKLNRSGTYLDAALSRKNDSGVRERQLSMQAALTYWRQAPILGVGIGTYYQDHKNVPHVADTIHNTFLWLLAETGSIGAALFTGFFLTVFIALLRQARASPADPFLTGVLGMLLVFAGASIGTDILYQRYFWFILGLALVVPRRARPDREAMKKPPPNAGPRTRAA